MWRACILLCAVASCVGSPESCNQALQDLKSLNYLNSSQLSFSMIETSGIDLDDIGLVVNFDPPDDNDTYTHRVGRTARAGRTGRAITMVLPDQVDEVGRMAKRLGQEAVSDGACTPSPDWGTEGFCEHVISACAGFWVDNAH